MRARRGLTLIEVLVALVILAVGAASWASFAGQGAHAMRLAAARDAETQRASQLLARLSLWNRERLDALGAGRRVDGFVVAARPRGERVVAVTIADSAGQRVILRTSLYKSGSP